MSEKPPAPRSCAPSAADREATSGNRPRRCPRCGSDEVRMILYGLIDEPVDMQQYSLGGCIIRDERWSCGRCLYRW